MRKSDQSSGLRQYLTKTISGAKSQLAKNPTPLFVLAACLMYFVRASQYILKPQLYAEDGGSWLQEGHNHGLEYFLRPYNGFLHLTERVFGFTVAQISLYGAPFLFNITALLIFAALIYYLFTSRTKVLNNQYERIFMLFCLGFIGNVDEFFFNFSNSVFLLGIVGLLIALAQAPKHRIVAICEKTLFTLTCFTIPFSWFYLPVLLVERFKYRRKDLFFLIVSAVGTLTQLVVFLTSHVQRSAVTIRAMFSKYLLLEIYNQIIIPTLRLARVDMPVGLFDIKNRYAMLNVLLAGMLCLAATVFVLRKSNKTIWYLFFFLAAMTVASLKSPTIPSTDGVAVIRTMATIQLGDRYFIYGIIGLSLVLIKLSCSVLTPRARYAFMVAFLAFGLLNSLQLGSFFIDKHFLDLRQKYSQSLDNLKTQPRGSVVLVPGNPPLPPHRWDMTLLVK